MSKRVIELIRVSTEGQAADDRASIPAQRTINRRTARIHGLEIIKSIEIVDVSGAAILFAPEMQELWNLIQKPDIHGVVAREFSRLMRPEDLTDFRILQHFADTQTLLYLPDGPIDFASKTGKLMGIISAGMAGMQRMEFRETVWNAKEEKRNQGKLAQSRVCLPIGVGYTEAKGFFYTDDALKIKKAFKLMLTGETSYANIEKKVGISQYTIRFSLRNPIYTGWRVIDKKRDMSMAGKILKRDGRQGDRKKIKRAEHEIIRVKVIEEPLVSEKDFNRVQQIMNMKATRHWRRRADFKYRFTYNGFLVCGQCNQPVYTSSMRTHDYYVCKWRRQTQRCDSEYMRRNIIDPQLDQLFMSRLTDRGFLLEIEERMARAAQSSVTAANVERLTARLESLESKRRRVLDTFFEGLITADERNSRLFQIDKDVAVMTSLLAESQPSMPFSADLLAEAFKPLAAWEFLTRDKKRKLLSVLIPEIKIANYRVSEMSLMLDCRSESVHTAAVTLTTARKVNVLLDYPLKAA